MSHRDLISRKTQKCLIDQIFYIFISFQDLSETKKIKISVIFQ